MRYCKDKNFTEFIRLLLGQGWKFSHGRRHGKLTSPSGRRIPVPCTPSDHRALRNFQRDIRKLEQTVT